MAQTSTVEAKDSVAEQLDSEMRETLVGLCARRAATYGLLSRLYRVEVDEDFYSELCAASFPAKTGNDRVDGGYRKIATYCATHGSEAPLDLARDFVRVFIGHGNNAYSAAYPFESVYTSEKRLMMQEARDEIVEAYREAGLKLDPSWHDPEDHIALLLEYMQVMSERAQASLVAGDDDAALETMGQQRDFFLRHIAGWTPMLTADMERFAQTDFYKGLAELTAGFVAEDRLFLTSVVVDEGEAQEQDD